MHRLLLILLIFIGSAGMAAAQLRSFPENAKAGALKGHKLPEVKIDKKVYRITPATRIVNQHNVTITPPMLPQSGAIAYRLDPYGYLSEIWLLTPLEAASLSPTK